MYFGLEVIQEYSCGAGWPCETSMPLVREFLHGDPARYPEQVAMIRHNPDTQDQWTYHYLHDVLGSVIGVVDEDGDLVERFTLDAGERLCRSPRAGRTRSIRRRVKGTTYDPYGRPFIETWDATANEGSGAWVERASECGTGVPACGQMPYSSIGNPFMWTGHRYDAVVGLYHTLFRFYEPLLGRWPQRDPIEYKGGSVNLYEYVGSSPLFWIDPFGLRLRVGGSVKERERFEKLLQVLCRQAKVDKKTGDVTICEDATPQPSDDDLSEACKKLKALIDSGELYVMRVSFAKTDTEGRYKPGRKNRPNQILVKLKQVLKVTNKDGTTRNANDWELVWHETIHAVQDEEGRAADNEAQREIDTINEMNTLRDEFNQDKPAGEQIPHRDPKSHPTVRNRKNRSP